MGESTRHAVLFLGKTGVGKSALVDSLSHVFGSEEEAGVGTDNKTVTRELRKHVIEDSMEPRKKIAALDTAGLGPGTKPLLCKLFDGTVEDGSDMLSEIKRCAQNAKRPNAADTTGTDKPLASQPEMKPDDVLVVIDATTPFPKYVLKDIPAALKETNRALVLHVIATKIDKLICEETKNTNPTAKQYEKAWEENQNVKDKREALKREVQELFPDSLLLFITNIFRDDKGPLLTWKKSFIEKLIREILDKQ